MNEYKAVLGLLMGSPQLAALVGTRIHTDVMPDNPVYPAVTFQKLDGGNNVGATSNPGICWALFQVSAWAASRLDAAAVVQAATAALDRARKLTVSDVQVDDCFWMTDTDHYDPDTKTYFTHSKFKIHYREP